MIDSRAELSERAGKWGKYLTRVMKDTRTIISDGDWHPAIREELWSLRKSIRQAQGHLERLEDDAWDV